MSLFVQQAQQGGGDNSHRSTAVYDLLSRIEQNMERRQKNLANDKASNKSVSGRTVSNHLANVKGMQKHLSHMRAVRVYKSAEEVPDTWGHGTLRKGEMYMKYKQ